jgi:hypothetical protein
MKKNKKNIPKTPGHVVRHVLASLPVLCHSPAVIVVVVLPSMLLPSSFCCRGSGEGTMVCCDKVTKLYARPLAINKSRD